MVVIWLIGVVLAVIVLGLILAVILYARRLRRDLQQRSAQSDADKTKHN